MTGLNRNSRTLNWSLVLVVLAVALLWSSRPALADTPPSVSIVAPSQEIGDAGAALGNVWDMSGTNDIAWVQPNQSNQKPSYTLLGPGSVADSRDYVLKGVTPQGSDLASAFYVNSSVGIPTNIYHHLIYRSYIPGGGTVTNARLLYSTQWGTASNWQAVAFPSRRSSKPQQICGYDQWCTYYIDLSNSALRGQTSPNPWDWGSPAIQAKAFGLWPHEQWYLGSGAPAYFLFDFVYLTGDIVATQANSYQYTLRWQVNSPMGRQVTSRVYYRQWNELQLPSASPACNSSTIGSWTLLTQTTLPAGGQMSRTVHFPFLSRAPLVLTNPFGSGTVGAFNQSYIWNMSASNYSTNHVYYVCVGVDDGVNPRVYQVSSAPVIKAVPPTYFYPTD